MLENQFEIEANTIEEAVQIAINKTGLTKDKLEIKIICEESKGLFGMQGVKLAKIKVNVL